MSKKVSISVDITTPHFIESSEIQYLWINQFLRSYAWINTSWYHWSSYPTDMFGALISNHTALFCIALHLKGSLTIAGYLNYSRLSQKLSSPSPSILCCYTSKTTGDLSRIQLRLIGYRQWTCLIRDPLETDMPYQRRRRIIRYRKCLYPESLIRNVFLRYVSDQTCRSPIR